MSEQKYMNENDKTIFLPWDSVRRLPAVSVACSSDFLLDNCNDYATILISC